MASVARSRIDYPETSAKNEAYSSGVSWAAVTAGAFSHSGLVTHLARVGCGDRFVLGLTLVEHRFIFVRRRKRRDPM